MRSLGANRCAAPAWCGAPAASTSAARPAVNAPHGFEIPLRGRRARTPATRPSTGARAARRRVAEGSFRLEFRFEAVGHGVEGAIRLPERGSAGGPERVVLPAAAAALRGRVAGP